MEAGSSAVPKSDDALLAGMGGLAPGRRLGRYELIAPIGRGGMGVVWAARLEGARGFSKLFAVKTMFPALSADPRFEEMFVNEASIASAVRHPNVCEVIELGESDGLLYLVMEWVDGDTLAALSAGDASPPLDVVARVCADVALGLHAAHEATGPDGARLGIVHRDVSPQNVLVGSDGTSRIADFGIAKRDGGGTTEAGFAKGKVRYMAPEQVYSEEIDRRTDIFALGVVLYEATTGRHPFAGAKDLATLSRIADPVEAQPPREFDPAYPAELEEVVLCALAKEPGSRFATMADFADALEGALPGIASAKAVSRALQERCGPRMDARRTRVRASGPSVSQDLTPARRPRKGRTGVIAAAALGVAAVAIAFAASSPRQPKATTAAHEVPVGSEPSAFPEQPSERPQPEPKARDEGLATSTPERAVAATTPSSLPRAPRASKRPDPAETATATSVPNQPTHPAKKSGVLETRE